MAPVMYLIPGLGVDERLFFRQKTCGLPIKIINWKTPHKNETLESYARRMAEEIPVTDAPVVLGGVSFGGMMAVEISKYINVHKLILISSIKTAEELPLTIRIWRYLPVYKLLPGSFLKKLGQWGKRIFGKMNSQESKIFTEMVACADPSYIRWAIHQIVRWQNSVYPKNIIHIHGTGDLIFPACCIREPWIPIEKGSHIMIVTAAEKINSILEKECRDIV